MADHLVDQVGLRRVGGARVADVLGRVEDAVGERAVELTERHKPGGGHVAEAGERLEPGADLLELRDVVPRQAERGVGVAEGAAGVALVLGPQLAADRAPDLLLVVGVVDRGRRLPGVQSSAASAICARRAR